MTSPLANSLVSSGWIVATGLLIAAATSAPAADSLLPGFEPSEPFAEQVRWSRLDSGVRVFVNAPRALERSRRLLVVFATPNGNSVEQSLGCASAEGRDWRFDIQHVAAQIRRLRELDATRDIVLAIAQAPKLSWPTFRREHADASQIIRGLVESLAKEVAADRVALTCHSGGGSFLSGYLNAHDELPATLARIVWLDANYSYSDDERHGDKLLAWLQGDAARQAVVVAYDDREITLDGKKVVGPDGGTFRASERMLARFRRDLTLADETVGPFRHVHGKVGASGGGMEFFIHPNPDNKILHTALVGEMNGLLHGLTLGTDLAGRWGEFGGPRAYTRWVQPEPFVDTALRRAAIDADAPATSLRLPPRPDDAPKGSLFARQIADLPPERREAAIRREIASGNVPEFLRTLVPLRVAGTDAAGIRHVATYYVTSDVLAVGTDEDFFRVPMSPSTAVAIADAANCWLITRKISDDVFAAAPHKLEPKPLTEERESAASFYKHHQLIEDQLGDRPRNMLVAGIKKDVVLTNRLRETPQRVALYGWHYPHGEPIQPLYVGHVEWYVDYSHGIRLIANDLLVDRRPMAVADVLKDPDLHVLLSDEGPLDVADLRRVSQW
jgi:hypothetical protein